MFKKLTLKNICYTVYHAAICSLCFRTKVESYLNYVKISL